MTNWLTSEHHLGWLAEHARELLRFGRRSAREGGGAYWLDDQGAPDLSQPLFTWITTRAVHVYGLGSLMGIPGCTAVAQAALDGLVGPLHDDAHGGWYPSADGATPAPGKSCYDHAFVMLAGSTAVHAGLRGAGDILTEATSTFLARFWDDEAGRCVDAWDAAFEHVEPYRGLNANMHGVEAMLSVAGTTGDEAWLHRAARVADFVIAQASANHWRIPEHYRPDWTPDLEFNRDRPADQFKPYGATIGHAFEWARLFVHLANAPITVDCKPLVAAAEALFERAVDDGWRPDGADGFVYTTDWDGRPVVADRLHWVTTEAINTAAALFAQTGESKYAEAYRHWWDYAADHLLDTVNGGWHHQLDATNQPATSVWRGKPDLYHAFQTTLIPSLPLYPMLAPALAMSVAPNRAS
jgi:sulfoquinovose isomerase